MLLRRSFLPGCLLLLCASSLHGNAFNDYLIAHWTFENTSLESQTGTFSLKPSNFGRDPSLTFEHGKALLGRGKLLSCAELNSNTQPTLRQSVTIWMRCRLSEVPVRTSFLVGFTNQSQPGDWANMVFGITYSNEANSSPSGLSVQACTEDRTSPVALGQIVPVVPGEELTLAATFDGVGQTFTLVVNGKSFQKKLPSQSVLDAFSNFRVGRLKEAGAIVLQVDEIRIYSVAIPINWIGDIQPTSGNQ